MDQQTLELLRALQSSERNAEAFAHILALLALERARLSAADDRATLADISELLEVWAETAPPAQAAAAVAQAAAIADEDLEQAERSAQLYRLSLERAPSELDPLRKLEALFSRRGQNERFEAALVAQAELLRGVEGVDPTVIAGLYRRLGQLRGERGGELDSAVEAYEQALDLAVEPGIIRELAELYAKRGGPDDRAQAADLYCALADVLGAGDGIAILARALDQVPEHDAALDLLESYVPLAEQASTLTKRWTAYIESSENASGVDKRRAQLAHAYAAQGRTQEALVSLTPLIDKRDPEALRLQAQWTGAAKLETPPALASTVSAAKSKNGAVLRPATLVGFRLPPAKQHVADAVDYQSLDDGPRIEGAATRVRHARSGETLVGFRLPPSLSGVAGPVADGSVAAITEPEPAAAAVAAANKPTARIEASSPRVGAVDLTQAPVPAAAAPNQAPIRETAAAQKAAALKASRGASQAAKQPAASSTGSRPAVRTSVARTASVPNPIVGPARLSAATPRAARMAPAAFAAPTKPPPLIKRATTEEPVQAAVEAAAPASIDSELAESSPHDTEVESKSAQASLLPVSIEGPYASMFGSAEMSAQGGSHRKRLLWGGVSAAAAICATIAILALSPGSKQGSLPLATRSEAVAPKPLPVPAEPPPASPVPSATAMPVPATPPPVAAPAPDEAVPAKAKKTESSRLEPGKPHVTGGGLSAAQISLVLEDTLPALERCYVDVLQRQPRLHGRAVFAWTIDKSGHPGRVRKLSGSIKDEALQQCSLEALRKARFPKPKKKSSEVVWPLDYRKG